jgi:hypothetical protein
MKQYSTIGAVRRALHLPKNTLWKLREHVGGKLLWTNLGWTPTIFVYTEDAISAYRETHSGASPTQLMMKKLFVDWAKYTPDCHLPSYNPNTQEVQNGVSCAGCRYVEQNDKELRRCVSLKKVYSLDIIYSHEEFLEHFVWCKKAQALWSASQGQEVKA